MEEYWEWFCSIPGIYRPHREILLRCFHDPKQVWEAPDEALEYLQKRGCVWVQKVLAYRAVSTPQDTADANARARAQFVSMENAGYPARLLPLRDRPYGLFFRGELPAKERTAAGIVGGRMCTSYGRGMAETLASAVISAGGVVVSGGAYGIDGAAQWAALEAGGKSYAVLGCGVDICYPSEHRRLFERLEENGALISEFPPGTRPMPTHFPMRNRIISGLSDAVVVIEAKKKSGSLITADYALDQGRQVYAVPGRPDDKISEGCNELISQGAGLIQSEETLIEALFPGKRFRGRDGIEILGLAPAEKLVYSIFGLHGNSLWELEEKTSLALSDLSDALLSLEYRGLIREIEQNFYVKVK